MNNLTSVAPSGNSCRVMVALTERIAELLHAPVFVTDAQERVVSSSLQEMVGLPFAQVEATLEQKLVRFPLNLEEHAGDIFVGGSIDGEEPHPRLVRAVVEMVVDQVALLEQLARPQSRKDDFIHSLLSGSVEDEGAIRHQALFFGMDLNPPRAVIFVDAADYILGEPIHVATSRPLRLLPNEEEIQRRVDRVIHSIVTFFHLPSDTICAYLGNGEIVILKASDTKNLWAWSSEEEVSSQAAASWANLAALRRAGNALLARLRRDTDAPTTIGLGRYHPGISGLARSYQDARAAIELGRRFRGVNQVHCLADLGTEVFIALSDERTKFELATFLLSPLTDEPELLQTLDTYFDEDCHTNSTAERLSIHRNTLTYRLEKVASLTGLDPRCFDDAVQLRLALLLRSRPSAPLLDRQIEAHGELGRREPYPEGHLNGNDLPPAVALS
ncbi:MAG: helix-turn-helix domain-containing protein [Chloroflexota bacterium]|nr:helix-turn-helix domain-containing protein [Chloroflexota bacterium]